MTAWLTALEILARTIPEVASALHAIFSGAPEGQRVRDILDEKSASERAAEELRRDQDP